MNLFSDIILDIFKYLDLKDIISISQANKHLYNIYSQNMDYIYSQFVEQHFPPHMDYKLIYQYKNLSGKYKHYNAYKNAICNIKTNEIKLLYSMGININSRNKFDSTPLMYALQFSIPRIINVILDFNHNIHLKDIYDFTPLMYALRYSTPEIINRILDLNPHITPKIYSATSIWYTIPQIKTRMLNMM